MNISSCVMYVFDSCFQWFTIFTDYCEKSSQELSESKMDLSLAKFSRSIPEPLSSFGSMTVLKELAELIQTCPSASLTKMKEMIASVEIKGVTQLVRIAGYMAPIALTLSLSLSLSLFVCVCVY
jgi:hypothetical protein